MLHIPVTVDSFRTGLLTFQTDAIRRLSTLRPGMISITTHHSGERHEVEAFIEGIYAKSYGAVIGQHYPMLVSVRDVEGRILAALGFRCAADHEIFLEQYMDVGVEDGVSAAFGNPNLDKTRLRQEITFGELFGEYMERYSKPHKKSWAFDEREVNKFLSNWFSRKISTITKQEIAKLHDRLGKENGLYQANRVLERIRAIFNKAIEWGWEGMNPSLGIKKFREKARDRFLQADELTRFHTALAQEPNETARDYILMSMLTGARKSNVLAMRWEEINWERAEWRIAETKNGEPVILPLLPAAIDILQRRRNGTNKPWVFPSARTSGHFADPKKAWQRLVKAAKIDDLRIHDIRRTLGSYQAITGASLTVIGKSLGHKSQQATAIYSRLDLDPVRQSLMRATEVMFAGEPASKKAVGN